MFAHPKILLDKVFGNPCLNTPVDTNETFGWLSELNSPARVRDFLELLRQQISVVKRHKCLLTAENLRLQGNEHYKNEQYAEALKCYIEAQEESPFDWRLFSNKALAFIALGRFEEAMMSAQWASIANQSSAKGVSLQASAYAHLGYVDVAEYLLASMQTRFSREDQMAAKIEVDKVSSKIKNEDRRYLTAMDMHRTCEQLFSGNPDLSLEQIGFDLTHLFQAVISFGFNAVFRLEFNDFFSRIFSIPQLRKVFNPPENNFSHLQYIDWFILYQFFMIVHVSRRHLIKCGEPDAEAFYRRLLSCQSFVSLLQSFGRYLAQRETLLTFLSSRTFGQCGCTNFFIQLVSSCSNYPGILKNFINISPFNDLTWYPEILLLTFCTYDLSTGLTDGLISFLPVTSFFPTF